MARSFVALLCTPFLVAALAVSGCAGAPGTTKPAASDAPPASASQAGSAASSVSPDQVAAAKKLVAEQRPSLDPGHTAAGVSAAYIDKKGVVHTTTATADAQAVQQQVVKMGHQVLFPNHDVVGSPIAAAGQPAQTVTWPRGSTKKVAVPPSLSAAWSRPMFEYHAAVATGTSNGPVPDGWRKFDMWHPTETDKGSLYKEKKSYWAKVTIRGIPGRAYVLWGTHPAGKDLVYLGTLLLWTEDGVAYELSSQRLYADQLLAIAETMVSVKL